MYSLIFLINFYHVFPHYHHVQVIIDTEKTSHMTGNQMQMLGAAETHQ